MMDALSESTLTAFRDEAQRAYARHGENSMLGSGHDDGRRLAILLEEVGEVAKELNEAALAGGSVDQESLRSELVQVGAMAAAWIETLANGNGRH